MDSSDIILSPSDYFWTGDGTQPLTFAFYYPNKLNAEKLQDSLDKTLKHFPYLASKLIRKGENIYEYRMREQRITLDVRETDSIYERSQNRTLNIQKYVTPIVCKEDMPLSRFTLTHTPDGSVLGVSISHGVTDGFSYFHFWSSWARICRGEQIIEPTLERDVWSVYNQPSGNAVTRDDVFSNCGLFLEKTKRRDTPIASVEQDSVFISNDTIYSHLEKAKKDFPDFSIYKNDIINAILWKRLLPEWIEDKQNPATHFTFPIDIRRIHKNLSPTYLGCGICLTTATAALDDLETKSIEELSIVLNEAGRRVDEQYVEKYLQTLADLRMQSGISPFEAIFMRHPKNGMIISNLSRLPVGDLDFGTGSPEHFVLLADIDRGGMVLAAENGFEVLVHHPAKIYEKTMPRARVLGQQANAMLT